MASLRQGYEEWVLNEPEDLQSDRPTDEEMAAFAEGEQKYEEEVRLSLPLGASSRLFVHGCLTMSSPYLYSSRCSSSKLHAFRVHLVSEN